MKAIKNQQTTVVFNEECYSVFNEYLDSGNFSKVFLLVDSNTHVFCKPYLLDNMQTDLPIETIEIKAGEAYKTIETCVEVWNKLTELEADRNSLLINLGGGVATDLGGFVACTFKRGIKYINIPTSLLAMVDASVGGKTGVDLGNLKNLIGVIHSGDLVLVDTKFLKTLPEPQFKSGLVEMLKHGLISGEIYWNKMVNYIESGANIDQLVHGSVVIKNEIVSIDPKEKGIRKVLNYGHTLGHAIESYCLKNSNRKSLLHGEAVAIGLILESYISHKLLNFPLSKLTEIKEVIFKLFPKEYFDNQDIEKIIYLTKFDKKNTFGHVNFVLLEDVGKPKLDCQVDLDLILDAFKFYKK